MSDDVQGRHEEQLLCALGEDELRQRGADAARLVSQIDQLDEQRRLAASDYRDRIKELRGKLRELSQAVRERQEERAVPCETEPNYAAGLMVTVRLDTGEIIRSRPLTSSERQGHLFPVRGRKKRAAEPDGDD